MPPEQSPSPNNRTSSLAVGLITLGFAALLAFGLLSKLDPSGASMFVVGIAFVIFGFLFLARGSGAVLGILMLLIGAVMVGRQFSALGISSASSIWPILLGALGLLALISLAAKPSSG